MLATNIASVLSLFACLASAQTQKDCDCQKAQECSLVAVAGKGFEANFYNYPLFDYSLSYDPYFYKTGYMSKGFIGSKQGIQEINFSYRVDMQSVVEGEIYGFPTTVSNFTMSLGGYFYASKSGNYDFSMSVDDGAFLQFGAEDSCCGDPIEDVTSKYISAGYSRPGAARFTLKAGKYYPIKIVYVNMYGPGSLEIGYRGPGGTRVADIGSSVYQFEDMCQASSTSIWSKSAIATSTESKSSTRATVSVAPSQSVISLHSIASSKTSSKATSISAAPSRVTTSSATYSILETSSVKQTAFSSIQASISSYVEDLSSPTLPSLSISDTISFVSDSSATFSIVTGTSNTSIALVSSTSIEYSSSISWSGIYTNSSVAAITESIESSEGIRISTSVQTLTSNVVSLTIETLATSVTTCDGNDGCDATTTSLTVTNIADSSSNYVSQTSGTYVSAILSEESDDNYTSTIPSTFYSNSDKEVVTSFQEDVTTWVPQITPSTLNTLSKSLEKIISDASHGSSSASLVSTYEGGASVSTYFVALVLAPILAIIA